MSRREQDWREDGYADDLIATSAIKRPWSGEGLPPVGVVCEAGIPHTSGASGENRSIVWIEGRVIAYHEIKGRQYAWFAEDDDGFYPPGVFEFRPIRTSEQIESDARIKAAQEWLKSIGLEYGEDVADQCENILMAAEEKRMDKL